MLHAVPSSNRTFSHYVCASHSTQHSLSTQQASPRQHLAGSFLQPRLLPSIAMSACLNTDQDMAAVELSQLPVAQALR